MRARHLGCITALAAFSLATGAATAKCQLQQLGTLPVDMQGLRPLVTTKINGVAARFELDTGSFYSIISRDAATRYQLPVTPPPRGMYITGVGGNEKAQIATAASFDFLGVPLSKISFLVIDQDFDDQSVGLIGQNLLRVADAEYDLANGIVRFIRPVGCERQPLAYWAVNTPYSSVDLQYMDAVRSNFRATAMLNGARITVAFDTGSPRSFMSLPTAERLGITPSSPGVKYLGLGSGIGPIPFKAWVAPDVTFQIGGEKVEHAHILIESLGQEPPIGYVGDRFPDMLLGEDFFLSHRIYVAYSQNRLYFTYNGGPLFNLNLPQVMTGASKPPPIPGAAASGASATDQQPSSDAPTDADGYRRRGMAYASMQEFDRALSDLTRACELGPQDAENHYDRGLIYEQDGQPKSALQDFDAAITLQAGDIDAHLSRAELLQAHPDVDPGSAAAEVKSDLDTASSLAPTGTDLHRTLSHLYSNLGDYPAAIGQIDQWLNAHPVKSDQAAGLGDRCRIRATANRDLSDALEDCNRALDLKEYGPERLESRVRNSLAPDNPDILTSRGLVYLRLGNLKDAIGNFDSALRVSPNVPTPLYGRGLTELRLGEKAQGQDDLAAAEKLDKGVAQLFAKMGLTP